MDKKSLLNTYGFDSILKPIIFLLFGFILMTNPIGIVNISIYVFCAVLLFIGIFKNIMYYKKPEDKKDVITGTVYMIMAIVIALVALLAIDWLKLIFKIVLAVFLAYTVVLRIINTFKQPANVKKIYIISSLFLILCIVLLLVLPIELLYSGLVIILYSIMEIFCFIIIAKFNQENK